jgi:cobalt-zinc-cadmium efflux system membrane fusion protein
MIAPTAIELGRARRRTTLAAALLCTAAMMSGCRRAPAASEGDRQPTTVAVAARAVQSGALRAVVQASGIVIPADGAEFLLIAPEPARLLEVAKAAGDTVAAGEVLARFELAGAAADVERQRAEVARLQAQVENARAGQARTRDLVARGLIPRNDLDISERELMDAQQSLERTTTIFTSAEAAASRAVVRAPFAGMVTARLHDPGDLVQPVVTDPVLRIVDPARVEILASVAAADAPRVLPGATSRIPNPAGGTSLLTVAARTPVTAATGMAAVRLVPAQPLAIAVDTPVAVEIDAEERSNVVFVPAEAIIEEDGRTAVMIAAGDRAERRQVTIGITTEAGVELTSGVRPGELLITQGHIGLADGAVISVAVR